jgi:subtilisin family serine protease
VNFEVFTPGVVLSTLRPPRPLELVTARSVANLADSPGAFTVAALDVTSLGQEFYSSEGPTNGPGGAETGGSVKPDISGFANVSTQSYGPGAFNGTSAATPHVSGAAALVLDAYPTYSPDQLQSFLEGRAVDLGDAGMDVRFGHGRLYLGNPPGDSSTYDYRIYLPAVFKSSP